MFIVILSYFSFDYLYYSNGDLYWEETGEVDFFTMVEGEDLWIDEGQGFEVFDMKGVNLGLGKPGKFATEYGITKEEYLRWFEQIQDLGANLIRTYTVAHEDFYEAFYEYNENNPTPLYLIHGVWVDEYLLNSHLSAFDTRFYKEFLNSSKDVVDVIHGRHKQSNLDRLSTQSYKKDISPWVYGYIVGVEWDGTLVAYTDETVSQKEQFKGKYFYTEGASNFEILLAMIGEEMVDYETSKYGTQRTLAFSNWPTTDPLKYSKKVANEFQKYAFVDSENIKVQDAFKSGQYASYHAYPYYPEYLSFEDETIENTYLAYLEKLVEHHEMPVVISEFGVSSARGQAAYEQNTDLGRDQGHMSEKEQGEAIVSLSEDIKSSGAAGGIVFVWHDEWFKRTWNTVPFTDLNFSAYWSDYQTNEQYFGLLSFDPGIEKSIAYVDGDRSDWLAEDLVHSDSDYRLSMKYDEKFIYFLAETEDFDSSLDKLYIPIDLTPQSGSRYIEPQGIKTSQPTDFLIEIDGEENSRVWVHERYNAVQTIHSKKLNRIYNPYEHPPAKDSTTFQKIELVLHEFNYFADEEPISFSEMNPVNDDHYAISQTYESGKLTYGNANPEAAEFNSLADFSFGTDFVEIKLPWGLLNFSDPSEMKIHDDYYDNYGVEHLKIKSLNTGIGDGSQEINMVDYELEKLGKKPEYHERLKDSYYILQDYWNN